MPIVAISAARTMNATKLAVSREDSEVRAPTSSQTTASPGSPGARFSASSTASEMWVSLLSIAIEPDLWISSSLRSERITLASSRAMSTRIRSPCGLRAAPGTWTRLTALSHALEEVDGVPGLLGWGDDP